MPTAFLGENEPNHAPLERSSGTSPYRQGMLYNGATGEQIMADLFVGVILYQKLYPLVTETQDARPLPRQCRSSPASQQKAGQGRRLEVWGKWRGMCSSPMEPLWRLKSAWWTSRTRSQKPSAAITA